MTFVCNAGLVIALAKIDHLHLLRELADLVLIPEPVFHEVLLVAKQRKFISAVVPLIEQARNHGYWLSDELLEIAKSLAHE